MFGYHAAAVEFGVRTIDFWAVTIVTNPTPDQSRTYLFINFLQPREPTLNPKRLGITQRQWNLG